MKTIFGKRITIKEATAIWDFGAFSNYGRVEIKADIDPEIYDWVAEMFEAINKLNPKQLNKFMKKTINICKK